MPKLLFDSDGNPYFVPDEEEDPWLKTLGSAAGPREPSPEPVGVSALDSILPETRSIQPQQQQPQIPAEELSKLILDQEGDTGQKSDLRGLATETTSGVDKPEDLPDVFEVAARRTREAARPSRGGRQEGPFTKAVSNPVTMGKFAFDVTPPGALLKAAGAYQQGNTFEAIMDALGAIPGMSFPARVASDVGGELVSRVGPQAIVGGVDDSIASLIPSASAEEAKRAANYNELQKRASQEWAGRDRAAGGDWPTFLADFLKREGYSKTSQAKRSDTKRTEKRLNQTQFGPSDPYAVNDPGGTDKNLMSQGSRGAAIPFPLPRPEDAPVQIDSVGGPTAISMSELKTIGGLAAISLGMAFAPKIFSKLKLGRVPTLRPVEEAVPGTVALSRPGDLARTYDDANAGAMRVLERARNYAQVAVTRAGDEVWKTMRIQTRATANALSDSAINVGRMETPTFSFSTRVPLAQLARLENDQVRQYLHVMDTIDDIKQLSLGQRSGRATGQTRINPGPIRVRGMDLADASQLKRNLEAANPQIIEISKAYRENLKSMRRFETTGEYATLSIKDARFQNAQRSNYVPFGGARVFGEYGDRGSAIEHLANEVRVRLRNRMQNEAVGKFVDEMRRLIPDTFKRVTMDQLKDNPNWRKNIVEIYRRGVKEQYTTDPFLADVLRMDPYFMAHGPAQILYTMKRLMEVSTTGELAPWFAATSVLRSWQIGKLVPEKGMKSPSLAGTVAAIPQQILPQLANRIAPMINDASHGWLGNVFGQGAMQALSTRLAHAYERSLYAQLQTVGGGRGSILQQQLNANNRLTDAISHATGPAKELLEGYRSLLNAVHNAPAFNYARKNQGRKSLPELAMRARHMTGDPRVGGEYYTRRPGNKDATAIRFEDKTSRLNQTLGKAAQGYGWATEAVGRTSLPWFNATIQGVKRIGESYLADPAKFVARAWLYQGLPAAATYVGARALGTDPNGRSYVDFMMNGRSEYNKMMNFYIPVPGRPVEEGIEMPGFHEMTYLKHMMEVGLDHAFRSSIFTESEDFMRATKGFLGIVAEPATPPVLNLGMASQGMIGPQGPFTGEAYRKKSDPFDQLGGLPPSIELYARAIQPGLADVVGQGYAAYTQTPKGFLTGVFNGTHAMGRRIIEKTPVLRDIVNIHAPVSGNNAITEELFKKNRALRNLESYYKTWIQHEGLIGVTTREGRVTGPAQKSAGGEAIANQALGAKPPTQAAGLNQPEPTNPLYKMFAEEVHKKFVADNPVDRKGQETGAIGFQSLWNRYGLATRQLERIKKVNEGNNVTWQEQLGARDEQTAYLRSKGVDTTDIKSVRNFYEHQRQDAARVILFTIRSVEDKFSKQLGRPIKIEDINPYGRGLEDAPDMVEPVPTEF